MRVVRRIASNASATTANATSQRTNGSRARSWADASNARQQVSVASETAPTTEEEAKVDVLTNAITWDLKDYGPRDPADPMITFHELLQVHYQDIEVPSTWPRSRSATALGPAGGSRSFVYTLPLERVEFEHMIIHNAVVNAHGSDDPAALSEAYVPEANAAIEGNGQAYLENDAGALFTGRSFSQSPPPFPYSAACQ